MLSLTQKQSQQQKLTPQQLQYLKLLQLSVIALEQRVKEELEINPLLEEGESADLADDTERSSESEDEGIDWDEFMPQGEYEGYNSAGPGKSRDEDAPDIPQPAEESLIDQLLGQLRMQALTSDELALAEEILGNIDADGYLRRDLSEIVEDLNQFIVETGLSSAGAVAVSSGRSFSSYETALGDRPFGRERLSGRDDESGQYEADLDEEEEYGDDRAGMDDAGLSDEFSDDHDGTSGEVTEEEGGEESGDDERTIADLSLEEMANLSIEELAKVLERGTVRVSGGASASSSSSGSSSGTSHQNGVIDSGRHSLGSLNGAASDAEHDSPAVEVFSVDDAERILHRIQRLDPPGIGARDLRESLLVQLEAQGEISPESLLAKRILDDTFHEFTMKHFEKICRKLDCTEDELRDAIDVITSLNPKPGEGAVSIIGGNYVTPDFQVVPDGDDFVIIPNDRFIPTLRINPSYRQMLGRGRKRKQGIDRSTQKFLREKMESAKWFIASIHQRRQTMLKIMRAIVELQIEFFRHGPNHLKPMIYKDVAERIGMDISTVCRVVNGKYVQTDYGVLELRYFFSEALETAWGEEVSNKVVKAKIKDLIGGEDKQRPLSDEALSERMKELGYNVARRTVAKYREQMNIPVARLRRTL